MIASVSNNSIGQTVCFNCGNPYGNIVVNCLHDCRYVEAERFKLWLDIFQLSTEVYACLRSLDNEDQTLIFLGAVSDRIASMLGEHVPQFEFICVSSLHRIWSKYRHHANLPYVATG